MDKELKLVQKVNELEDEKMEFEGQIEQIGDEIDALHEQRKTSSEKVAMELVQEINDLEERKMELEDKVYDIEMEMDKLKKEYYDG